MTTTTTISIPYSQNNQIALVESTYGVPCTAYIWGAGGGSTALYPGAGGGYSQVSFVAKPGDSIEVTVGQGGGAGGVTAPQPAPPITWSTRDTNIVSGQLLYPTTRQNNSALLATYGVWSNPQQFGGTVDTGWFVTFPVSGYYTIKGSSTGVGFLNQPEGGGGLNIGGTLVMSLPGNAGGFTAQVNRYIPAGSYSVYVSAEQASNGRGQASGIAFSIEQTNPPRITTTPAGLPGAAYIALLFNSRFPPTGAAPVYPYGNGDSFLDQWGVWNADQSELTFDREYEVSFLIPYTVTFEMSANHIAGLNFNGSTIITRSAANNPNTPTVYRADFAAGTYTMSISATGVSAALNRVGVTLSYGSLVSFSGGRGGISDPTSTQGFGAGGGGASVLAVNRRFIGVGAGGGGGAGAAPTNLTYVTTKYTATVGNPYNWPTASPPAGTNGYIVDLLAVDYADVRKYEGIFWTIVINGTVVYATNREPPVTLAKPFGVGEIYPFENNPGTTLAKSVSNFEYISLNTSAITDILYNGQNGQDVFNFNTTDTGGGGGGGGGARGGNGGAGRGSGGGGYSGHNGLSLGTTTIDSTGRLPYTNSFYPGGGVAEGAAAGTAANGGNGYVILEFQTGGGGSIKDGGEWKNIQTIYVNDQGVWRDVKTVFVNDQGVWKPVQGGTVPLLNDFYSLFGAWPRPYSAGSLFAPPPPAPDYSTVGGGGDGWGFDTSSGGGGGGGGKVICTALYELGYMEKEIFEYDQAYGLWLYQNDFVSYRGYRAWADVLVKLVKGHGRPVLTRLLFWKTYNEQQKISQQGWILLARIIGGAFSKEIARRAGHDVPFSIGGWLCVTVGLTVNKAIGYVVKKIKTTSTIDYKE